MAIITAFQAEDGRSIRLTGSICGYCIMVVFVFWGHEASVRFTLPALKTDIKKVQRKKRRNAMLSNSIKLEQMNRTHKNDSTVAFWYCLDRMPCIRS